MTHCLSLLFALALASAANAEAAGPFKLHGPAHAPVFALDAPALTGESYAITGRVAYEGVAGDGYR